jgi:putative ABC transport system permease protein
MAPRWRKAVSEIAVRPGRSALAVLAMAIGIGALATLAFKHAILRPVLATMFGATQPASAIFYVDPLDDALVEAVQDVSGVGDAEARPVIMARLRVGRPGAEEWMPAILFVVRAFDAQRINLFEPNEGAWPPNDGETLLERSAVSVAAAARGDDLLLRIAGGGEQTLRFAGTVHAPGLAPAWMEHTVYGFIPWTSHAREGEHRESSQLLVRVAEHDTELGHINEVVECVRTEIESRGSTVRRVEIPTPGRHPHAAQMRTFMYLVGVFGVLAFLLSAVLVANMIHTLQSEQIKQVGVMKALGATRAQIAGVYLTHVGLLAAAALCVGVPCGWVAGSAYARFSAGILNADVSRSPFPVLTLVAVIVVGVLVPLLAALVPVWRASRITVREALAHAPSVRAFGTGRVERGLGRIQGLPRPLALALRATFVRRGRLALTVGMLAIAGAMFMSALNVSAGWESAATETFERRRYDLIVHFATPQTVAELNRALATVPSVARAEYWPDASPYLIGPSGAAGTQVVLLGIDPASTVLEPKLTSGQWLSETSRNGVVLPHAVSALHPSLDAGDTLAVRLEGRTLTFPIVGVVKELLPQAIIYAPRGAVLEACGQTGDTTRTARIVLHERGAAAELAATREIERLFERSGIEVASLHRMAHLKGAVLDHLVIIQVILTLAAAIVVFVAVIGLTSTLTINVVQRTREIGVMSALGATSRMLAFYVWCEGLLIALLSWCVASVLAAPISYALEVVTGRMFFKAPLDFTMSAGATALWLALVLVLASVASFHPARRAAQLTVREAIAHV